MADAEKKDAELEAEEPAEGGGEAKKKSNFLPLLLKLVAVGLGAIALMVTVSIIMFNIMNKGGKNQTAVPETEAYVAVKPVYTYFTLIDEISTRTSDVTPYTVLVKVNFGFDEKDTVTQNELTGRRYQIQDFLRNYFSRKSAEELRPENEARVKNEIKELLNTTVLDKARVREVLFDKKDVVAM